jgi:hypothetical protein
MRPGRRSETGGVKPGRGRSYAPILIASPFPDRPRFLIASLFPSHRLLNARSDGMATILNSSITKTSERLVLIPSK